MTEYVVEEKQVLELLNVVNIAKRVAAMELFDKDFGSAQRIQKQKVQSDKGRLGKKKLRK
jgi:hypothetical protein